LLSPDRLQGSGESRRSAATAETLAQGQHVMTVCNACRYCEGYCPVFQAMENCTSFAKDDVMYLANLCHNCGECLYACQYAPPHEFGINVPRALAEARIGSYEEYCWPAFMSPAFRRSGVTTSLVLSAVSTLALWLFARPSEGGDFYAVIRHDVMVAIFGAAGLFAAAALAIGYWRAAEAFGARDSTAVSAFRRTVLALRDVSSLRHLHATGKDCASDLEVRTPWRRHFHHFTFYGFALCFASTSVAAIYHVVFGWRAPYAYGSVPVILGTLGGVGLVVGPLGLLAQRHRRDPDLADPSQRSLDVSFIVMLLATSLTGLLLLAQRGEKTMPALLVIHLGFVLGLFMTLPYGKFVHGIYRTAALLKFSSEAR
jgi:citrate/tricarballylate utilization protein